MRATISYNPLLIVQTFCALMGGLFLCYNLSMDIFSHGLWAAAAAKGINISGKVQLRLRWAAFWGLFPDIFAFGIPLIWIWYANLTGGDVPSIRPGVPETGTYGLALQVAASLYNISHSLVIFALVAAVIFLWRKKKPWEMGGWLLHILMDIPTHTYEFFPTPALWPISSVKFNGVSWGTPWFMVLNYSALLLVFLGLWWWQRNKRLSKY